MNQSNQEQNKLWVDQRKEFYSKLTQEWLDNDDVLMYSIHNEGNSLIAERFIKTLKSKIFKKMTPNYSKFYLPYLNRLVDQYNNTYHDSLGKKFDYSAVTEKTRTDIKAPKFKADDRVRIPKYRNIFSKCYTGNWSRERFIIDSVLKTSPWTFKINDLNGKIIIGSFYEK